GLPNADVRDSLMLATKWLYERISSGELKLKFRKDFKKKVLYHTACHMQKMGWQVYSIALLSMIPGVELTALDQNCCGIAGTFGFKKENYPFSQEIGSKLFDDIRHSATPDAVVSTDCETCKWQIEMSTGMKVLNPIEIIAEALDC
nr:anaerobic glycerol-3-phosphate dehydrogenase subunit C [Bacteroidales bacterium]